MTDEDLGPVLVLVEDIETNDFSRSLAEIGEMLGINNLADAWNVIKPYTDGESKLVFVVTKDNYRHVAKVAYCMAVYNYVMEIYEKFRILMNDEGLVLKLHRSYPPDACRKSCQTYLGVMDQVLVKYSFPES